MLGGINEVFEHWPWLRPGVGVGLQGGVEGGIDRGQQCLRQPVDKPLECRRGGRVTAVHQRSPADGGQQPHELEKGRRRIDRLAVDDIGQHRHPCPSAVHEPVEEHLTRERRVEKGPSEDRGGGLREGPGAEVPLDALIVVRRDGVERMANEADHVEAVGGQRRHDRLGMRQHALGGEHQPAARAAGVGKMAV